ncbi:MAG TPA: hypothetical protein VJA21_18640 [Verrucomicrobiae bacterium]
MSLRPPPSMLWVLVDENIYNINDASMVGNKPYDCPGSFHNGACGVAFADGHSEIHKWRDQRTVDWRGAIHYTPLNPDVTWLQERTSARKEPVTP